MVLEFKKETITLKKIHKYSNSTNSNNIYNINESIINKCFQ